MIAVVDVRVTGANQLADLARDLKAAGDKQLRREMLAGIRRAANPLAKEVAPKAAREGLPKRGGLNEYVAAAKFGVRTRTTGNSAGVRIVGAKGKHDINAMDAGKVRHLTFGRPPWQAQTIEPGWWTRGMSDEAVMAPMRRELLEVLDEVAKKIARGGRRV